MSKVLKLSSLFVMVLAFVLLCGCAPKDVAKAKEKMEEAGYLCVGYEDKEAEGFVGGFAATKVSGGFESITAALYDSSKAAKEAAEELGNKESIQVIGKWVVWGSEGAIKAFKK